MSGFSKGIGKAGVSLKWDPAALGSAPHDLDLIAAVYASEAVHGPPAYLVHFDSRSPDGTITLQRDSADGKGFGDDEVITLELDRLAPGYVRVVVGVAIQQRHGRLTFGQVAGKGVQVKEGYTVLAQDDLGGVPGSTAATVAEFVRDSSGSWLFRSGVRGFDTDPADFASVMGGAA